MIEEPFSDFAKNVIFASDFFSGGRGAEPPGKLKSVREGQNFHGGFIPQRKIAMVGEVRPFRLVQTFV